MAIKSNVIQETSLVEYPCLLIHTPTGVIVLSTGFDGPDIVVSSPPGVAVVGKVWNRRNEGNYKPFTGPGITLSNAR